MYEKRTNSILKHLDFIILDEVLCIAALFAGYLIRFGIGKEDFSEYFGIVAIAAIMQFFSAAATKNYHSILRRGYFVGFTRVVILALMTFALTTLVMYLMKTSVTYSRLMLVYAFAVFVPLDYVGRLVWRKRVIAHKKRDAQNNNNNNNINARVLVYTNTGHVREIVKDINGDFLSGYRIAAVALTDYSKEGYKGKGVDVIPAKKAADFICRNWIDEVFIYGVNEKEAASIISPCAEMGVTVHVILNMQDVDSDKQFVEALAGHTVLTTAYNYMLPHQAIIKRAFDIFASIIGCVFALLIMLICGPIIYSKDPGPIIFKQERIGRNGRHFFVYKLRSMYMNAEEMKKEYLEKNRVADGYMFKLDNDPRILPGIGKFIRNTSLDEFPQFFNVLFGDMSLVGTRPPTVDEWEKYKYHHRARLAMRPGITGMWQVSGRSEITNFEDVVKLDTYYITHFRLSLDLKILMKTVVVLFGGKGAM